MENLKKKIKWEIAKFLNNFEETCWADLVVWATTKSSLLELWPWRRWYKESVWGCDCLQSEGAYCGKCYETGRLQPKGREIDKNAKFWSLPFKPTSKENVIIKFLKE